MSTVTLRSSEPFGFDPRMHPEGVEPEEASSSLVSGFRNYTLVRTDASVATLYNAQSGLFRGIVALGGSPRQVAALDARIAAFDVRGTFALTEPGHGSEIGDGLETAARGDGARFFADAEAAYSYEGSHEINALIVGRAPTGEAAFT